MVTTTSIRADLLSINAKCSNLQYAIENGMVSLDDPQARNAIAMIIEASELLQAKLDKIL